MLKNFDEATLNPLPTIGNFCKLSSDTHHPCLDRVSKFSNQLAASVVSCLQARKLESNNQSWMLPVGSWITTNSHAKHESWWLVLGIFSWHKQFAQPYSKSPLWRLPSFSTHKSMPCVNNLLVLPIFKQQPNVRKRSISWTGYTPNPLISQSFILLASEFFVPRYRSCLSNLLIQSQNSINPLHIKQPN